MEIMLRREGDFLTIFCFQAQKFGTWREETFKL